MRSVPLLRSAAALLFGALVLAGCGGSDGDDKASDKSGEAGPSGGAGAKAFPATVDSGGAKVTIAAKPKKIVSLSPSSTEMLFAIGAGTQVTAVDDQSNFPADAPKTKLSGFKPNVEAITNYTPDLVVASDDVDGLVAALGKLRIPVVLTPAATTFDDAYRQLNTLGTATGHTQEADAVAGKMKSDIAAIVAKTPKPAKQLSYFHELDNTLFTSTSKTFIGQVYALFGLRNIADDADKNGSGYPQLSAEYLVQANPDLVFLADTKCCAQNADAVGKRPGWDKVTAVQKGGVVGLDDDIASRWGPRVVDLVRAVSDAVAKAGATQG
ncbi:ABC transporter substrate-binding protein [Streptomyces sp. SID3343]|uniref:ABC transporter substrate-binding protein n=1 Tax=Streptomyces sp. SID3343 TaxID=2690260 RepID=UPI00136BA73B|nr:ABC transporter substrate-binding protein [Streptomyces sp. SID3343]MYW04207.1 ABC transporter substrate-binding protein [Streptomyces sp. SID3343]